jgi:biopolymer transport protein ExbB
MEKTSTLTTITTITNEVQNQVTGSELNLIQEFAKFMDDGGVFMWIILIIWTFGVVIALERFKSLFKYDVDGPSLMNEIKKSILTNDVQSAIQKCTNSKALLPSVMKNGLKRANQTKEQIRDALEASILEVIPTVEKRLHYLALIANVSTLIGLLGTIYGLIQSFAAVASADPASKAQLLAMGISKAMNTTAFGLISAISIMVIHSFLSNKSEKIISEVEQFSVKLVDLLSTKKSFTPQRISESE